jgi:hypothetical protein
VISAKFIPRFYIRLKHLYGLDVRALSLMRIALSLILLVDLCIRANSLTAFYTETGVVPFNPIERSFWNPGYFSLFEFADTYAFALTMFIITGIVYLFLLAGYKTKVFSILAWFLLTSLQNRNTLVLQSGDDLLRLVLFWGIFMPWGNFYSIDSKKISLLRGTEKKKTILTIATVGYVILLFSIYFFTGLLKESPEWNSEGTAIYYALSLDQMTWPLGKVLLAYPEVLKYLTIFIRWFEMLIPFLLFVPFKNARFRLIFIFCIAALHLSISLTLFVGLFYLIGITTSIGLLPSYVMDWFDKKIKRKQLSETRIDTSFFKKITANYYFNVVKNSFLFFCIALCMLWNISTVNGSGLTVANGFFQFGYSLRFNQNWGMFAPTVFKDDGWYIMEGSAKNSLKIDINRKGAKVDYTKPTSVLAYIKNDRWRKFYENYVFASNAFIRPYMCTYMIHDWNKNHADAKIDSLKIIYMKEFSVLPNQKQTVTKEVLCTCGN